MKNIIIIFLTLFISTNSFAQLSGDYSVGIAKDYTTIGDAITALNTSGVSGACTFYLYDETYSETEMQINSITGASSTNTITFKPYTAITPEITIDATGNFTEGQKPVEISANIEIIDMFGKVFYKSQILNSNKTICLNSLTKGIYFVRIIATNKTVLKKVIIE